MKRIHPIQLRKSDIITDYGFYMRVNKIVVTVYTDEQKAEMETYDHFDEILDSRSSISPAIYPCFGVYGEFVEGNKSSFDYLVENKGEGAYLQGNQLRSWYLA